MIRDFYLVVYDLCLCWSLDKNRHSGKALIDSKSIAKRERERERAKVRNEYELEEERASVTRATDIEPLLERQS